MPHRGIVHSTRQDSSGLSQGAAAQIANNQYIERMSRCATIGAALFGLARSVAELSPLQSFAEPVALVPDRWGQRAVFPLLVTPGTAALESTGRG
jgi:hypothetical protein